MELDKQTSDDNQDNIGEILRKLYHNQLPADLSPPKDVTFIIGKAENAKEISAHKFLLSLRSPVFHSMFNGQLAETSNTIRLIDVDPVGFQNVLRYIYCDEIIDDFRDFSVTYLVADRYLISDLCKKLLEFIDDKMSIDNSILIYDQFLELEHLLAGFDVKKLNEIISLHSFLVFNSESFLKINQKTLIKLLESNSLIIDEIDLFSACLRWINEQLKNKKEEVNLANQKVLFNANFKHLIRFPIMKKSEFFGYNQRKTDSKQDLIAPAKSGLFTNDELNEFEQYFEDKNSSVLSTNYNFNKRNDLKVIKLVYDWRTDDFKMMRIDEELSETGNFVYRDQNGHYVDDLLKQTDHTNRFQSRFADVAIESSNTDEKNDDFELSEDDDLSYEEDDDLSYEESDDLSAEDDDKQPDEIKLFKIQKFSGNEQFESRLYFKIYNIFGECLFDSKNEMSSVYTQNGASYIAFYPTVSMKVCPKYTIEASHFNHWSFRDVTEFKIEQIFKQTNNGPQIDVQLKKLKRTCVLELYFIYK